MNSKTNMLAALVAAGLTIVPAQAAIVYANSAGNSGIQVFNVDPVAGTETKIDQLNVTQSNGRGVVTVGDTLYYTDASSGNVSSYTLSTHTDHGTLFSVAGSSGLATIAYDGTNLWLGDYSGTNHAYEYSLTGTLLSTVSLNNCTSYCDGLEFANGGLVSNRADGGYGAPSTYDAYSLAGGAPTTTALITTSFGATGIAYDGTYYYVSDILHDQLVIYDSTGAFQRNIALADGLHTNAIEDLSVNYAARIDTGGAPEPATMLLFGSGLLGVGIVKLRRNRKA